MTIETATTELEALHTKANAAWSAYEQAEADIAAFDARLVASGIAVDLVVDKVMGG